MQAQEIALRQAEELAELQIPIGGDAACTADYGMDAVLARYWSACAIQGARVSSSMRNAIVPPQVEVASIQHKESQIAYRGKWALLSKLRDELINCGTFDGRKE